MIRYAKAVSVLLLIAVLCCGGAAAAGTVEGLNVTYQLGGVSMSSEVQAVGPVTGGGFILGMANSSGAVLMKTDAAGKEMWRTVLPGDDVRTLVVLNNGGSLVATFSLSVEGTEEEGYTFGGSSWLIRTDDTGNILWQEELVGIGVGDIGVSGNKIIFAGWFWDTDKGFTQTYLLENGAPGNDQIQLGNESASRIPLTLYLETDGTLVLAGGTTSDYSWSSVSDVAWIAKVKNGVIQRETILRSGSVEYLGDNYGQGGCTYAICKAQDGGYIVVGSTPPYLLTFSAGIAWASHVNKDLGIQWTKELDYCFAPFGVVEFGDGYLIAGMDGHDDPVWLTLSVGGAITETEKISQNGKNSRFNDVASISAGSAALVGWTMPESTAQGILITLSDSDTPADVPAADGAGLWIAGAAVVILILAGAVYFVVIRKPEPAQKPSAKKGGKKN